MVEPGVVFFLLDVFDLLGVVLGVRVVVETAVGGLSEPPIAGLELIGEVGVVIFFLLFSSEFFGIGAFASQGEGSSAVFIGGFHVLIVSSVPWKLSRV